MKLIEAGQAAELIAKKLGMTISELVDIFADVPAVDAVPVVRCKDCYYYTENHYEDEGEPEYIKGACKYSPYLHRPYDYCSIGERKDGE